MKPLVSVAFAVSPALSPFLAIGQTVLFTESFEIAGPSYDSGLVTHTPAFHDLVEDDYWQRVQDSDINLLGGNSYVGEHGTFYWATEDTDDFEGNGDNEQVMDITGIDISGYSSLTFSGLFAADGDDGVSEILFDPEDHIHIVYQVDGGGYLNGLWFESSSNTQNKEPILQDTDFDGLGDGTQLTANFAEFTFSIPESGSSLDLKILVYADTPDEEIAFDYLQITGVPEPSGTLLLTIAGGLGLRRRR